MKIELLRHPGASFVAGRDLVHLRAEAADLEELYGRWGRRVVGLGLGSELKPRGAGRAYAEVYELVPIPVLSDALSAPGTEDGEAGARTLLLPYAADRRVVAGTYGLYRELAHARGWPAQIAQLGRYVTTFLGMGRNLRLLSLNQTQHASSVLGFAGTNKAYGRELLRAHGFPVAPGAVVPTPEAAVARAKDVGWPVVVKGLGGGNSEQVILGIDDEENCRAAAEALIGSDGGPILVEKMFDGVEVRAHFAAGRLHSLYRAEPRFIVGDGQKSALRLLQEGMPEYLQTMLSHPVHQRRLVFQFFQFGVRRVEDLARLRVTAGEKLRVSAATGTGMTRLADDALHPVDRARLEALFGHYGRPSAGVDMMLPALGAPLAEGGIVIELNSPCGFGYTDDPRGIAEAELEALVAGDPAYGANGGRVPLTIVVGSAVPPAPAAATAVHRLDVRHGWMPILADVGAERLLVHADESTLLATGMPLHLRAEVIADAPGTDLLALLENAGARRGA